MENGWPELEVNEDRRRQRHEWAIQRSVWFVLYLLLAGIALGILGKGPFSSARLEAGDDGLRMDYQRFMRRHAPDSLSLTVAPAEGRVRVSFDASYLRRVDLHQVSPQPEHVIADDGAATFVFLADAQRPVHILFDIQPDTVGMLHGWVAAKGGERRPFSQFVYP